MGFHSEEKLNKCLIKKLNKMKELKRFYNYETGSVLRFKPLFQRVNQISKKKEIIGVCWDTDVLGGYGTDWCLKKGHIVILKEPSKRVQKNYKGESLYELTNMIEDMWGFVNKNYISHKKYNNHMWEDYKD
jgi:hypothetical protein